MPTMSHLQFLGAARQVTGSQYYLEAGDGHWLVDCGMFQERDYQSRNWDPPPYFARNLDAVLLTHAHVDHCGLLPRLLHWGFRGKVLATPATAELAEIVLHDSAHIQAEDVAFKRKRHQKAGREGRHPYEPLYTADDVDRIVRRFEQVPYGQTVALNKEASATFHDAGHILGSAMVQVELPNSRPQNVLFSGDIGQCDRPILRNPARFHQADYVVMESTYGDRTHEAPPDLETGLARIIRETTSAGGNVVIPVFAIGRTQELLFHLARLARRGLLPPVDVFLDSPMAIKVTEVFARHAECFDDEMQTSIARGESVLAVPRLRFTRTTEESQQLNGRREPAVILATSGMCTAGRVKHHLTHNLPRRESTILFVGYQAAGTLGRLIVDGHREVRIHGRTWPVRARIEQLHGFSAHADQNGLLAWLDGFRSDPDMLFLTHGEASATERLAQAVRGRKGWPVRVPAYAERFELP